MKKFREVERLPNVLVGRYLVDFFVSRFSATSDSLSMG